MVRLKKVGRAVALGLGLALAAAACGGSSTATSSAKLKVAVLVSSPKDDGGWGTSHYLGMQAMLKNVGSDKVQADFYGNLAHDATLTQVASRLMGQGYKVVVDNLAAGPVLLGLQAAS
jgi:basic membrane lipoprotein Med (substrate-binding protein (PBP1-ABC) superfamily)